MKKFFALMSFVLSFVTALFTGYADEAPAKFELLNPQRIYIACPRTMVKTQKLIISDASDAPLTAVIKTDKNSNIISRNIHTWDYTAGTDVSQTQKVALSGENLRFKMYGDWDGTFRWKRPFTYQFDFTVNTLDSYYMMTVGNAGIKFEKDINSEDKYYITWDGSGESEISGQTCEFGKTYNIRIEADMADGGNVFAVFTDPETGNVCTSYRAHGVSFSDEQYYGGASRYAFSLESVGRVEIITDNEEMYYETYFIRSHGIEIDGDGSAINAKATVQNAVDKSISRVPYLFVGIYNSDGMLTEFKGTDEGVLDKQTTEGGYNLTSAPYSYSIGISVSELPDGDYTARTGMWRNAEDMRACAEVKEIKFTVADGTAVLR